MGGLRPWCLQPSPLGTWRESSHPLKKGTCKGLTLPQFLNLLYNRYSLFSFLKRLFFFSPSVSLPPFFHLILRLALGP